MEYPEDAMVSITYHGLITYTSRRNLKFRCRVDVTNFPFDSHSCRLSLMSWVYNAMEVSFSVLCYSMLLSLKKSTCLMWMYANTRFGHRFNVFKYNILRAVYKRLFQFRTVKAYHISIYLAACYWHVV